MELEACVHAKLLQSCLTLCDPMDCSPPGKNTGVGCHALLQGIFPTQGSNLHFLRLTGIVRWGFLNYFVFILVLPVCYYQPISLHPHACMLSHVPYGLQPARVHCPWTFPGKNTGLGCHFLLQVGGFFTTSTTWEALGLGAGVLKHQ